MSNPSPSPVSDLECYRLIRSQIEFEDDLISQRISWFVAAQSFLFSAYAVNLNAGVPAASAVYAQQHDVLFRLLPIVAIASCVLIYMAIIAGVRAQVRLRRFADAHLPPDHMERFPAIQGCPKNRLLGRAASLGMPLVFVIAWLYVLITGLR